MSIKIIEGKIGSGKTYYAVHNVFKKWYRWDDEIDEWVLKDSDYPVKIYTNIQSMKLGGDLNLEIEKRGGLKEFFEEKFQEEFCDNYNVIYIIDEAQSHEYFHDTYREKSVFTFFQKSRHMGIDIYLITQDVQSLARQLRKLPEYHIVALQRTKSIGKIFTYHFYAGKEHFKTKRIRFDQKVFNMYRSMIVGEAEKVKSAIWKYIIYFVLIIGCSVLIFKFVFMKMILNMGKPAQSVQVQTPEKRTISHAKPKENIKEFRIIGIVDDNYIVKTPKGLKKVKILGPKKKSINDEIRIENL